MDDIVKRLDSADQFTSKNVRALKSAFSQLEKQVKNTRTVNHAALTKRVDQLSLQLTHSIDNVKADISADLTSALKNPTVNGIEDAIARSDARLSQAETDQAKAIYKINRHIADLARVIDTRLKAQENQAAEQLNKINGLEDQITSVKSQSYERIRLVEETTASSLRRVGNDIVSATETLQAKIEAQSDVLKERVALIAERTQREFDEQKTDLTGRIEGLEGNQKNQSNYIDRAISKLASRIDNLEYGLSQIPESEAAIPAAGAAIAAAHTSDNVPQNDAFILTPDSALAPIVNPTPQAANPYPDLAAQVSEPMDDVFAEAPMQQQVPEAVYQAPAYETPVYQNPPAQYASAETAYVDGPQEYQPAQAVPQMSLQHQYVDPVQAAYQASVQQNAAVAYDQAPAYEQYAAPQSPPFPPAQTAPFNYNPDTGPTEFVTDAGIADNELPYSNPGYSEGAAVDGVSRPGHIAEKRPKQKRKKLDVSSALSALPITPRNLRVAGLGLVLATAGYFGLRGFADQNNVPENLVTEQIGQPVEMPKTAVSVISTGEPIGTYVDSSVDALPSSNGSLPIGGANQSLEEAANNGDPIAQFQLGITYLDAGRPQDGLKLVRASANQGQPAAQYRLAKLYEAGIGVSADPDMARQLTERAARAGNRIAMHDLGLYYAEGRGGIERNMETALSWFEKAAERGVVDSQYNLGVLFESSPEITRNPNSSFVWYSIAASQGDQLAGNRIEVLRKELSESDLKLAENRVAQFKPTAIDEVANGIFRNVSWTMPETQNIKPAATLVRDAQTLLSKLGYEVGVPDGDMGPKTQTAVRAFEKANGLAETGIVSASLVDRLEAAAGV